jgi:hypothetical protein
MDGGVLHSGKMVPSSSPGAHHPPRSWLARSSSATQDHITFCSRFPPYYSCMLQVAALSFAPRAMRLDTRAFASSDPNHAGITGLQYYGKGGWVRACIAATYLEIHTHVSSRTSIIPTSYTYVSTDQKRRRKNQRNAKKAKK